MGRKRSKSTPQEVVDVEPDRISCLPGHVIDCILSYLPIKEAVRTSVLSNKWRNKWYTLPNLVFDKECVSHVASQDPLVIENQFVKIVDHVLLVHSGPIYMFKFSDRESLVSDSADIDRWILHLTRRSIKELVLEVYLYQYNVPWCLFSCQSLHHLKLKCCWLEPPMTFEGFRNLKSIDIVDVTVAQEAFENLISNCPLLEELKLTEVAYLGQINIHAPNLKLFEIVGEFEGISFVNTFQLTTIVINSWLDLNYESNQHKPHGHSSNLLKFFDHQPHIQSLEIHGYFLKYLAAGILPVKLPTPCIELSFLSLSINFYDLKEISAALCILKSSPNLRKLEIFARRFEGDTLTPPAYCWEDIFSGPVIPFRVRHVRIVGNGISGTKSELDFIKYLLLYSPVLEKMTVGQKLDQKGSQQCASVLESLTSHPYSWVFKTPVDPVAFNLPDYFTVISHPMDLGTIKSKLEKNAYFSKEEFASDVRLIFSNAMTYNPPTNDVHLMAKVLNKLFEKLTVEPFSNVIPELMMKALLRFKRASAEAEVIWQDPFKNGE